MQTCNDLDDIIGLKKSESITDMNLYNNNERQSNLKFVSWSYENEEILVEWCDIAQSYWWLHRESYMTYVYQHACFTIPIIILSTSVGAITFLQTVDSETYQNERLSPFITGGVNIFVGILATIQEYLKVSQLQEAHRLSYVNWDKFSRNIRIELSKAPGERMDPHHFIKLSRITFDNMMEISPLISAFIIEKFKLTFQGKLGTPERETFNRLNKPDICKSITSINEMRKKWFENDYVLHSSSVNVRPSRRRVSMRNDKFVTIINSNNNYNRNTEYNDKPVYISELLYEPPSIDNTDDINGDDNIIEIADGDDSDYGDYENIKSALNDDDDCIENVAKYKMSKYEINELMGNYKDDDNRIIDVSQDDSSNMNSSFNSQSLNGRP